MLNEILGVICVVLSFSSLACVSVIGIRHQGSFSLFSKDELGGVLDEIDKKLFKLFLILALSGILVGFFWAYVSLR